MAGRDFGNCTLRHVTEVPGTVTLVAPDRQAPDDDSVITYYSLTEKPNGVNTVLEFTGFNVSIPDRRAFNLRLEGLNALLNITDCIVNGAGWGSRAAFRVGSMDTLRPAKFVLTRTQFKNLQLEIALFGYTAGEIKGGRTDGALTWWGPLFRAEAGNLTIEDYSITGTVNSTAPLIQVQNGFRKNGARDISFWHSGLTMRNVVMSGNVFRGPATRMEAGVVRLFNVTYEQSIKQGPMSTTPLYHRALIRLFGDSTLTTDNLRMTGEDRNRNVRPKPVAFSRTAFEPDNDMDLMIDLYQSSISVSMTNSHIAELPSNVFGWLIPGGTHSGNALLECVRTSGSSQLTLTGVTFDNSYANGPFFDVSDSRLSFVNTLLTGTQVTRGSFISLKERSSLSVVGSQIASTYAFKNVVSTDLSSTVAIDSTVFRQNIADRRDVISINYQGPLKIQGSTFQDNLSRSANLIRIAGQTLLTIEQCTFSANADSIVVDSLGQLVVNGSTFAGNSPETIILSRGNVSILDSMFYNNSGRLEGGAISHIPGKNDEFLTISNTSFVSNKANGDGGAIYVDADFDPMVFQKVVFKNNTAKRGGAVFQLQSEWARVGFKTSDSLQTSGNVAAWQGNDLATGIASVVVVNKTSMSSLSGAYMGELTVRALDAYGNTFRPPRDELLKVELVLNRNGTLVGSTSKFMLTGETTFSRLQLYAPVGEHTLLIKPTGRSYDPSRYNATVQLVTESCSGRGMEERVVEASQYPACVQAVCTNGCLSDYGYCRENFCICTAADREGLNCGLKKGNRDVMTLNLPNTWVPNAINRDKLLETITNSLTGTAKPEFRSFTGLSAQSTVLQRRADSMNAFKFSLQNDRGEYIEEAALDAYKGIVATAVDPVVGGSVTIDTVRSPKMLVARTDPINILFMVLAGLSIAISIVFAALMIVYRNNKAVKASSVTFSQQIILGSVLGYSLIFLYIGQLSKATCISQIWVGGVGFTLAVGNLIGKNWRIYKIFTTKGRAQAMKDMHVLFMVLGFLLVEVVIDGIWSGIAPLEPMLRETESGRHYACDSTAAANRPLTFVALAYKAILLLTACTLAFLTRNVDVLYGESKAIGVSSYSMLLSGAIVVPLVFLPQTSSQLAFYLKCVGILVSGLVTTFSLFWPKLSMAVITELGTNSATRNTTERRTSRKPRSQGGTSSIPGEETSVASAAERTPQQAEHDSKIVQEAQPCSVYVKSGFAGKFLRSEIFMDNETGIIFIRQLPKDDIEGNIPSSGDSFRLEHLTQCSWNKSERMLFLQAGGNSLQVTLSSTKILQAYVSEIQLQLAKRTGNVTASTPVVSRSKVYVYQERVQHWS
ncbi:7 transmembrane sweet-taste receptor of 3 GCPR-domain-containing protein [Powellomyces hirtus]|nr:7 transmembrane sweet-taste receptor of 3 GCPR-domain-containing protein [Powellomyces hirtus]